MPQDDSLWIADDNSLSIHEVNATTGALRRTIDGADFAAVRPLGGGQAAGIVRTEDIESLAYDVTEDTLYVFSGTCCDPTDLPTAYRLERTAGDLELESFQPLAGFDFTGAAWNPGDGKVYVGFSNTLRTYHYATNTVGPTFSVSGVSGIFGMDFTDDGKDLFIARSSTTVSRVDWASKTTVPGWNLDLASYGLLDTRAVEVIDEQLWVSDGFTDRPDGDPLSLAVFVFDVGALTDPTPGPPVPDPGPPAPNTPTPAIPTPAIPTPGTPAPGDPGAPRVVNLVRNAGFEHGLKGWNSADKAGVRLERARGGHGGSWSVRVKRTQGREPLMLNDATNRLSATTAGSYTGSLWVRSSQPGTQLHLRLREFRGEKRIGQSVVAIRLTSRWRQVTASLVPRRPGSSTIDYSAVVHDGPRRTSFQADDALLTVS